MGTVRRLQEQYTVDPIAGSGFGRQEPHSPQEQSPPGITCCAEEPLQASLRIALLPQGSPEAHIGPVGTWAHEGNACYDGCPVLYGIVVSVPVWR